MTRRSILAVATSSIPGLCALNAAYTEKGVPKKTRTVICARPSDWKDVSGQPCEIRTVSVSAGDKETLIDEAWTYPTKSVSNAYLIGDLATAQYIMSEEKGIVDLQPPIGEALDELGCYVGGIESFGELGSYVCGIGRSTHRNGWWGWSFDDPMNFGGVCGFFGVGQEITDRDAWYWKDFPYQLMETDYQAKVNASYDSITSSLYRCRSRMREQK